MVLLAEDYLERPALARLQWDRLRVLLAEILPRNRFYARKFAEAGVNLADLVTLADFSGLPFTTKAELLADQTLLFQVGRYDGPCVFLGDLLFIVLLLFDHLRIVLKVFVHGSLRIGI